MPALYFDNQFFEQLRSIMKIVTGKCRCPRLSLRPSGSANQTHPHSPPLRKKALLIGIQNIRQDPVEITQEKVERTAEKDVNAVPKPKKKKKQKGRNKGKAPKVGALRGPHCDVMQMKELLIGALYH